MSLKPDRIRTEEDLSFYMNEVGEAGQVVVIADVGTGAAMDDVDQTVEITATVANADVAGILMQDVVDIDLTKHHLNRHDGSVQKGGKVTVLRRGQITTDKIDNTVTAAGPAYLAAGGLLSTTQASNAPQVGYFVSAQDADGFVRVSVSL